MKIGQELSPSDLAQINSYRVQEFQSKSAIDPSKDAKDAVDIFFLLEEDDHNLLAFGRLGNLEIYFNGEQSSVLCVSTVVATEKNHGYGSKLLEEIKRFAKEKDKTLLGFCETPLLPFYRKCGFQILTPEDNKFVYADEKGEIIPDVVPGEVFYVDGTDKVIGRVLQATDKTVKVLRVN